MLEREEKLSAEEKREAELLYEREKHGNGGILEEAYNSKDHFNNYYYANSQMNSFKNLHPMSNFGYVK